MKTQHTYRLLVACLMCCIGLLLVVPVQAQTATQHHTIVLPPAAHAILYQPSSPSPRLKPRYCFPGDLFPTSRDACIRRGFYAVAGGVIAIVTGLRILDSDIDDELISTIIKEALGTPLLIMGIGGVVVGAIMIIQGSRMPRGLSPHPQ